MHSRKKNWFSIILFCCFLFPLRLLAQLSANDSAMHTAAVYNTIRQYHQFISNMAPLYNGPQYVEYDTRIHEGFHPFFQSAGFNPASIMYDHILYEKVPLKYDLVKNELVIKDPSGTFRFSPSNGKISYFKVLNHTFIRIVRDSSNRSVINTGFYDLLYNGNHLVLLQKETKKNANFVEENLADICASMQATLIKILLQKLKKAAKQYKIKEIAIAGGVSANSGLRAELQKLGETEGWNIYVPAFQYCTDNAGMIAIAGHFKAEEEEFCSQEVSPLPRMEW